MNEYMNRISNKIEEKYNIEIKFDGVFLFIITCHLLWTSSDNDLKKINFREEILQNAIAKN